MVFNIKIGFGFQIGEISPCIGQLSVNTVIITAITAFSSDKGAVIGFFRPFQVFCRLITVNPELFFRRGPAVGGLAWPGG